MAIKMTLELPGSLKATISDLHKAADPPEPNGVTGLRSTWIDAADFFDGVFARRAAPPATDLDFDGLADLLFTIMTVLWLWLLFPGFLAKYWLPYIPLVVLLEIYMTSARIRYPHVTVPHLEFGRKSMALFFFLLPVLIVWGDVPWFVHLVLIVGTASKIQLTWVIVGRVKLDAT